MTTSFGIVDYIMLATAVGALSAWMIWIPRHKSEFLYAIPPMLWSVDVAAFYITWSIHTPEIHLIWSAVVSLHAAFLLLGIALVMLLEGLQVK